VSPRRNRPQGGGSSSSGSDDEGRRYGGFQSAESWQGEQWSVRHVAGASAAGKTYRCPGCDQEIPPGAAHLVAWPAHASGPQDRRHWHNPCWQRRLQRHTRGGRRGR